MKRIMDMCRELNIRAPEFVEIGDLLRVNFYRPSYNSGIYTAKKQNGLIVRIGSDKSSYWEIVNNGD